MTNSGPRGAAVADGTALFRVLGEPSRLALLGHLLLGEHRVGELVDHLGLAQSTVSQHLTLLRQAGLVAVRVEGRASVYSVRHPHEVRGLLAAAAALERLGLDEGGAHSSGTMPPSAGTRSRGVTS